MALLISARAPVVEKALALARVNRERSSLHRLFPAIQSKLVVLDRAHAADRRGLVSRRERATVLAAKPIARLRRGNGFLHLHV